MAVNHDRAQSGYADAHPPREAYMPAEPEQSARTTPGEEQ